MSDAARAVRDYEAAALAADKVAGKPLPAGAIAVPCRAHGCARFRIVPRGELAPSHPLCVPCGRERRRIEDRWGSKKKCLRCGRRNAASAPSCRRCGATLREPASTWDDQGAEWEDPNG